MGEKEEKYIDLVFVRHGNTDDADPELLESGDAPLSNEGCGQASYVGEKLLAGMEFDLLVRGALTRMRQTTKHIRNHITFKKWICDTRIDPRDNLREGKLYPEGSNTSMVYEYLPIAIAFLQNLASRFPNGGKVLAIGSSAYVMPMRAIAAGIVPLNEEHYQEALKPFSVEPGTVCCFRLWLDSGKLKAIDLEEMRT